MFRYHWLVVSRIEEVLQTKGLEVVMEVLIIRAEEVEYSRVTLYALIPRI